MKKAIIPKQDWKRVTKYHVIKDGRFWKFRQEQAKHAIYSCLDKSTLMTEANYYVSHNGGYIIVHKEDATVDFILSNWFSSNKN